MRCQVRPLSLTHNKQFKINEEESDKLQENRAAGRRGGLRRDSSQNKSKGSLAYKRLLKVIHR